MWIHSEMRTWHDKNIQSLSLLNSTGADANLSTSNLSTLLFKLFKLLRTFFSLLISNLFALDYKACSINLFSKF